jgi:AbrB family looped-hinge helix DNA binding protein
MSSATLSSKFQILIPKDIRESMNLKPGQKLDFIQIGGTLRVVPQRSMKDLFGMAAHVTEPFERDRSDLEHDPELKAQVDAKLKRVLAAERVNTKSAKAERTAKAARK